jgi:hypothetical protein
LIPGTSPVAHLRENLAAGQLDGIAAAAAAVKDYGTQCRSEQNRVGHRLIQHTMNKRIKPFPPFETGQLWKTKSDYIKIWHIGKLLIDYKMMKQPEHKQARTHAISIEKLKEYLMANNAVLASALT